MDNVRELVRKINIDALVRLNETLSQHTTYGVGGPADLYLEPSNDEQARAIVALADELRVPLFVLGGGAILLVADRGVRGAVLATRRLDSLRFEGDLAVAGAGASMSEVALAAAGQGLAGLEFIYSMPGSVGGALWMNARCYGSSIADVLEWAEVLDEERRVVRMTFRPADFAYKVSPFQRRPLTILRAAFRLRPGDPAALRAVMEEHRSDRERKGHFFLPSAGSVFKNNPAFGSPSGAIIDSLGLRGYRVGGALVSERHANIIVNAGGATATDIDAVARHVAGVVLEERGFALEREVLSIGEW